MSSTTDFATASTGIVSKREDGLPCVVFERRLPHPIETVWAALTAPAQRAVWVPGIRFDPMPEAPYDIWFGDECEGPSHVSGVLGAFDPPRELALGSIYIQLRAEGESGEGCHLTFTDVLWYDNKRTKTQFANAVLGGWHQFLDRLEIWLNEGRAELRLAEVDYSAIDVPGRPDGE